MSYDDPRDYAHTDRNDYDREMDERDRLFEKEPINLQGLGEPAFPEDNHDHTSPHGDPMKGV